MYSQSSFGFITQTLINSLYIYSLLHGLVIYKGTKHTFITCLLDVAAVIRKSSSARRRPHNGRPTASCPDVDRHCRTVRLVVAPLPRSMSVFELHQRERSSAAGSSFRGAPARTLADRAEPCRLLYHEYDIQESDGERPALCKSYNKRGKVYVDNNSRKRNYICIIFNIFFYSGI